MIEYDGKNWVGILGRVRGSVIPGLRGRLLVAVAVGFLAAGLYEWLGFRIPPVVHTLVGVALGLLLVFRTNASYDRYWEGRRMIGNIVNRTRDLARQVATLVEGDDEASERERQTIGRLLVLNYGLTRQHLRKERDLAQLGGLVTIEERSELEPVVSRPALVLTWISRRLATMATRGRLNEERLREMDGNVTALFDAWGGAERIMKTPIPFAYAHHIKTFLAVFCFTVPFAMVDAVEWLTPLASGIVAFSLFGIDEIGVEIEDPFGHDPNDLPLDTIGVTIERDVRDILATRGHARETMSGRAA